MYCDIENQSEEITKYTNDDSQISKLKLKRTDVVNKTFIRSIKRYYCDKLCKGYNHLQKMDTAIISECLQKIDEVSIEIFNTHYPEIDTSKAFTGRQLLKNLNIHFDKSCPREFSLFYEVKIMLISMLLRKLVKKFMTVRIVKMPFSSYFDVVYKYTHKKMRKLVSQKCFQLLFKKYIDDGGLELMLQTDDTLKSQIDVYKQVAFNIINQSI